MKKPRSLYVVRKYIMASSAAEAIKLDKTTPPQDVWIDDEWKKKSMDQLTGAIGFVEPVGKEEEEE